MKENPCAYHILHKMPHKNAKPNAIPTYPNPTHPKNSKKPTSEIHTSKGIKSNEGGNMVMKYSSDGNWLGTAPRLSP